ncbi:MAG: HAMP domain-containing histidine kinase [Syntrophomonadaceae bacterium]|nr:HAMP domain-containing histidine kinase [Syntrophomonadaceae bacterium]
MGIFANREVKRLFLLLGAVFLCGFIILNIITYLTATQYKNQLIRHDYQIAGYLIQEQAELDSEIASAFTATKSPNHHDAGQALLEKSGYKDTVALQLVPEVDQLYWGSWTAFLVFFTLLTLTIVFIIYYFLRKLYRQVAGYTRDVENIINGGTLTRLDSHDEGDLAKLATSINMVTATLQTHLEKERQSRRFLKDTLTNISHQLKTPLSALMMYNEIMQGEQCGNENVVNFLNKSDRELERIQTLTTNLLKLARLDAGMIELNLSPVVINEILRQIAASFETRLLVEQKRLEILAEGHVAYPCDRQWMLEALSNLVKNAVEHTDPSDRIQIRVEETPLFVNITVWDNGPGIHPDDLNHIFKRFYRSRFSQNKQGTGIGLTLTKSIIELHGGFLSVESSAEQGTLFTVHLPKLTKL